MKHPLADRLKYLKTRHLTPRDQFPKMKLGPRIISLIILACTQVEISAAPPTPITSQAPSAPRPGEPVDPVLFDKFLQLVVDLQTAVGNLNEQFGQAGLPKLVLSEPIVDMDPGWNVTAPMPPIRAASAPFR
jgi:hypothetical protein